jgi:serine/threonine protein kinase
VVVLCLEKFQKSVEDTKDLFDQQSRNWEVAFEQARQEEQDRVERGRVTVSGNARKSSPFPHSEARFEDIEELGRGQFGHVSKVVQTGNPTNAPVYFARKFISAPSKDSGKRKVIKDMVLNEAEIMKKLQHHHIASMVLWIEEPEGFSLIMPTVADCNLRDFLGDCVEKDFPKDQITLLDNWFGCLTGALTFAHTNLIKHEDLKPSNILIKDDRVYLADFGCAQDFEHSQSSLSKDQTQMGTPVYWPPEPVKERGRKADVFALGCVFSEMFTVRQRRTLDAYMSKRRVDSIEDSVFPHRFSRNLPAVRDWLQALPNVKGDVPELLLKAILIMLHEETEHRQDAKQLKKLLRSEGDLLFCDSCL